jgi:hypothetical protein
LAVGRDIDELFLPNLPKKGFSPFNLKILTMLLDETTDISGIEQM